MTSLEIKDIIKRKIKGQIIMVESAVKNSNYTLAYENMSLIRAFTILLMEIEEGEKNASVK